MPFDNVLNSAGLKLLPLLKNLPEGFYLSGGTALSLQLNHRISVDFDFFSPQPFDTQRLFEKLQFDVLKELQPTIVQQAENTLDILTSNQVKVSFLRYRYPLIYPLIETPYFPVADQLDIGASKLVAVAQRACRRNYFDIYYLLQKFSLKKLFDVADKKYPSFNPILYLKALTYFDDCDTIDPHLISTPVSFSEVKQVLASESQALFKELRSS